MKPVRPETLLLALLFVGASAKPSHAFNYPNWAELSVDDPRQTDDPHWKLLLHWDNPPDFEDGTAVEFEVRITNDEAYLPRCYARPRGGKDDNVGLANWTFPERTEPYTDVWNVFWPRDIEEATSGLIDCGDARSLLGVPFALAQDRSDKDILNLAVGIREASELDAGTYRIDYPLELPDVVECGDPLSGAAHVWVTMTIFPNVCEMALPGIGCVIDPQLCVPEVVALDCPALIGFDGCLGDGNSGHSYSLIQRKAALRLPVERFCWNPIGGSSGCGDEPPQPPESDVGRPQGGEHVPDNRTLVQSPDSNWVYYILNNYKLHVRDEDDFNHLGFDWAAIDHNVSVQTLNSFQNGPPVGEDETNASPLYRLQNSSTFFKIENGRSVPFRSSWDDPQDAAEFARITGFPPTAVFDRANPGFAARYPEADPPSGYWPPIQAPRGLRPSTGSSAPGGLVEFAWAPGDNDGYRYGFEVCPFIGGECSGDASVCATNGTGSGALNEVQTIGALSDTLEVTGSRYDQWCWRPAALGNDTLVPRRNLGPWVRGPWVRFSITDSPVAPQGCPSDCSNHGECRNETCACDQGYEGASCNRCEEGHDGYPNCEPIEMVADCPEGERCNDGRDETENDRCVDGECQGTPVDALCDRPCEEVGSYVPNAAGTYCYRCLAGGCLEERGQRVPDAGVCTEYRCTENGVREVPLPNDLRFLCDDHDPATDPDICVDGVCRGEPIPEQCVDNDGDGFGENCPQGADCDDSNPSRHPGAFDECDNGIDEDCNDIDRVCPPGLCEGNTWSPDPVGDNCRRCSPDGSSYVEVAEISDREFCTQDDCNAVSGVRNLAVPMNGRACDDGQASTRGDVCSNGVCVGRPCTDQDQDGAFSDCAPFDCDDGDRDRRPGAAERCNGLDDDCDGQTDEDGVCPPQACVPNRYDPIAGFCRRCRPDGSGYVDNGVPIADGEQCTADECNGATGVANPRVPNGTACDDHDANTSPDACQDGRCAGPPRCIDSDGDGFSGNCAPIDCDDNDATVNPGEVEVCDNGIDEDCNRSNDACQCPDGTCAIRIDSARQVILVDITRFHLNDGTPLSVLESQGGLCYRGFARGEAFHDQDFGVSDGDDDGWVEIPIPNLQIGPAPYPGCRNCNVQSLPYRWVIRRCNSDAADGNNNTNIDDWRMTGDFYWSGWDDTCGPAWTFAVSRNAIGYYASGIATSFPICR